MTPLCRNKSWYRHDLQACASALLIIKTLGFGILLNAYSTDTAWSQVGHPFASVVLQCQTGPCSLGLLRAYCFKHLVDCRKVLNCAAELLQILFTCLFTCLIACKRKPVCHAQTQLSMLCIRHDDSVAVIIVLYKTECTHWKVLPGVYGNRRF